MKCGNIKCWIKNIGYDFVFLFLAILGLFLLLISIYFIVVPVIFALLGGLVYLYQKKQKEITEVVKNVVKDKERVKCKNSDKKTNDCKCTCDSGRRKIRMEIAMDDIKAFTKFASELRSSLENSQDKNKIKS